MMCFSIRRYSTRLAILCRLSSSGRSCHSSIWNIRFQGNPRKGYGHLYRGDVCENRPGFIGSFKGLEDAKDRRSSAQQYFHTFCGVLRVLMLFVAGVVVVAILLGKSPLTLFAGLGATSAVLMLVSRIRLRVWLLVSVLRATICSIRATGLR